MPVINWVGVVIVARAKGSLLNIVVSLPCTAYLCGSLIVLQVKGSFFFYFAGY